MLNLKKIINHLDEDVFRVVENGLIKNKSENYLYLLQAYRKNLSTQDIIKALNLNPNSFYVLKSRLYDKIQNHISGGEHSSREELLKKLTNISEICLKEPRETATAFLHKLEQDLLMYDMHNELLVVYNALKKISVFSDKYYFYSQLYNKHVAFSLSLEKSEEILSTFNRVLGQYNFSRQPELLEKLLFLRKEIIDHSLLNQSRQITIIKNLIELQLCIFCTTTLNKEININDLLLQTEKIINELPNSTPQKVWTLAFQHLFFEYYFKTGNLRNASEYYDQINKSLNFLLLYCNISCTSQFLISKIAFLQQEERTAEFLLEERKSILYDKDDLHTKVLLGIYDAMIFYHSRNYKDAAGRLNRLLNENSFKDYFHIQIDIKLTLSYIYIKEKEFHLAEVTLRGIGRKIKLDKINNYPHVEALLKVFESDIKKPGIKPGNKQKDFFTLFMARNKDELLICKHLLYELERDYSHY
ncbi:MAG: hypothetical protein JWO32_2945 [Bacteroidetes bacterium]|nr:hypothetical protein [Bacteroidota bacterium]